MSMAPNWMLLAVLAATGLAPLAVPAPGALRSLAPEGRQPVAHGTSRRQMITKVDSAPGGRQPIAVGRGRCAGPVRTATEWRATIVARHSVAVRTGSTKLTTHY